MFEAADGEVLLQQLAPRRGVGEFSSVLQVGGRPQVAEGRFRDGLLQGKGKLMRPDGSWCYGTFSHQLLVCHAEYVCICVRAP